MLLFGRFVFCFLCVCVACIFFYDNHVGADDAQKYDRYVPTIIVCPFEI